MVFTSQSIIDHGHMSLICIASAASLFRSLSGYFALLSYYLEMVCSLVHLLNRNTAELSPREPQTHSICLDARAVQISVVTYYRNIKSYSARETFGLQEEISWTRARVDRIQDTINNGKACTVRLSQKQDKGV